MNRRHTHTLGEGIPEDALMLVVFLISLVGLFAVSCWICYQLFEIMPFVLAFPGALGVSS